MNNLFRVRSEKGGVRSEVGGEWTEQSDAFVVIDIAYKRIVLDYVLNVQEIVGE